MKKVVRSMYLISLGFLVLLFLYIATSFHIKIQENPKKSGYEVLPQKEVSVVENKHTPLGKQLEYTWRISGVENAYHELLFYSYHQNVEVYVGKELIYSMKADADNLFGKTPGCVWNGVQLDEADNGRMLKVVLIPVYERSADSVPVFYFGVEHTIIRDMIFGEITDLVLIALTILVGCVFIVFTLYNYKNTEVDKSLAMLGLFAILLAVWKFSDMAAAKLMFSPNIAISMVPYLALMVIAVPFLMFMKALHSNKENILWYIPCFTGVLVMVIVLTMQFIGVSDMRESLWLIHINLIFSIVVCIVMVIREASKGGWNRKLKRNVFGMLGCALGFAFDITIYYVLGWGRMTNVGMTIFLIYIVVLGYCFMKESKQLMADGMRAKRYEHMAFHDQLTGLYNRTAFENDVNSEAFQPEHCAVVMLDLNDLKKCNDTLGHEAGDSYIKASAGIIQNVFGKHGRCYRIGGDEFCVLIVQGSKELCGELAAKMQKQIDSYNKDSKDIVMQIACGYEVFDRRLDYDIHDTSGRADKMMYHQKFSMKHVAAGVAE